MPGGPGQVAEPMASVNNKVFDLGGNRSPVPHFLCYKVKVNATSRGRYELHISKWARNGPERGTVPYRHQVLPERKQPQRQACHKHKSPSVRLGVLFKVTRTLRSSSGLAACRWHVAGQGDEQSPSE